MKAAVAPPSPKVIGLRAITAMPHLRERVAPGFPRCTFVEATTQLFDRGQVPPRRALFLQRLEISDHVRNLARVEPELRHCRMTCNDAFGESLFQVYDRILGMDGSERRCDRERARTHLVDRVALDTVRAHEIEPALRGRAAALCSGCLAKKNQQNNDDAPKVRA